MEDKNLDQEVVAMHAATDLATTLMEGVVGGTAITHGTTGFGSATTALSGFGATELLERTGSAQITTTEEMTGLVGETFGEPASAGKKSEAPEAIAHIVIAFLLHETWHELDISGFQ